MERELASIDKNRTRILLQINVDPERTPQLEASDQDLHNLLAEISTCT